MRRPDASRIRNDVRMYSHDDTWRKMEISSPKPVLRIHTRSHPELAHFLFRNDP